MNSSIANLWILKPIFVSLHHEKYISIFDAQPAYSIYYALASQVTQSQKSPFFCMKNNQRSRVDPIEEKEENTGDTQESFP